MRPWLSVSICAQTILSGVVASRVNQSELAAAKKRASVGTVEIVNAKQKRSQRGVPARTMSRTRTKRRKGASGG